MTIKMNGMIWAAVAIEAIAMVCLAIPAFVR